MINLQNPTAQPTLEEILMRLAAAKQGQPMADVQQQMQPQQQQNPWTPRAGFVMDNAQGRQSRAKLPPPPAPPPAPPPSPQRPRVTASEDTYRPLAPIARGLTRVASNLVNQTLGTDIVPKSQRVAAPRQLQAGQPTAPAAPQPFAGQYAPQGQSAPDYQTFKNAIIAQESGGRYGVANTEGSGATGLGQIMPDTAKALSKKLGIAYRPDLLSGTNAASRQYQDQLTEAAVQEAWKYGGGNIAQAAGYYFAGPNKKGWGNKTAKYQQDILRRMGQGGGALAGAVPDFINPFDSQYFDKAEQQLNQAETAALQTQEFSQELPNAPQLPDAPEVVAKDFAASDAALEKLKPMMITEKEKSSALRRNWLKGIGQAMASTPDGAGLGKVLANLGAGALLGRAAGQEEIANRMDLFDEKMAKFNALQFQQEGAKADQAYNEAVQEVATQYDRNMKQFQMDYNSYVKHNNISVNGSNVVIQKKDGNNVTTKIVPIQSAIKSAFAVQRANLYSNVGRAQNQGNAAVAGMTNQYIAASAAAAGKNGQMDPDEALFTSGAVLAAEAVSSGLAATMFAPEDWAAMSEAANKQVKDEGLFPGSKEFAERKQEVMGTQLYAASLSNDAGGKYIRDRLQQGKQAVQGIYQGNKARNATKTTKVGNVTIKE